MIANDLLFSPQTAYALKQVANDPTILKFSTSRKLPPSWTVLSQLTRLSESDFRDALDRGLITEQTTIRDARAISRTYKDKDGTGTIGVLPFKSISSHLPKVNCAIGRSAIEAAPQIAFA